MKGNKIVIIVLVLILLGIFYLFQERKFYYISDDKCITLWKTGEGAYIIQGKYYGIVKPSDNYIKTTNVNGVTFVVGKDLGYDYVISNDYGEDMKIVMPKYKIKYYPQELRGEFVKIYYENNHPKKGLNAMSIDIGDE